MSLSKSSPQASSSLLRDLRAVMRISGTRWRDLFFPTICAALASFCEGASLALLLPALHGMLTRDVSFVLELPFFGELAAWLSLHDGHDPYLMLLVMAAAFTTALARIFFQWLSSLLTVQHIRFFISTLRTRMYERLLSFGKLYYDKENFSHLQEVLTTYVTYVAQGLNSLHRGLYAFFTLFAYVGVLLFLSWKLTLLSLALFPLLYFSVRSLLNRMQESSHVFVQSFNTLARQIGNALTSIPLIHATSMEEREAKRFENLSKQVSQVEYEIERRGLLVSPLQELVLLVFLFALVSFVGLLLLSSPSLSIATYAVFLLILKRAAGMFAMLNAIQGSVLSIRGPLGEILSLFHDSGKHSISGGTQNFHGITHCIEVQDLSFSYGADSSEAAALAKVSFQLRKGEILALVGASGSGKSTIMNLLMRFYDAPPGSICVDGTDIREYSLASWRKHIALVSQDTFLFHASIRENLVYGVQEPVSDAEIWESLERAKLTTFIRSLPFGLDTEIGDRGVRLSGGERQRIAIARAILRKAHILFLDEATSALDSITERLVQDALEDLMRQCTTLIIAHRLSTIRAAHRVLVLEQGKIVESGSLRELEAKSGKFFEYWQEQVRDL